MLSYQGISKETAWSVFLGKQTTKLCATDSSTSVLCAGYLLPNFQSLRARAKFPRAYSDWKSEPESSTDRSLWSRRDMRSGVRAHDALRRKRSSKLSHFQIFSRWEQVRNFHVPTASENLNPRVPLTPLIYLFICFFCLFFCFFFFFWGGGGGKKNVAFVFVVVIRFFNYFSPCQLNSREFSWN